MKMNEKPWDRLHHESTAAYARFLVYRNLGPGRSLLAAYRAVAKKSTEKQQVPGTWTRDCSRFRWSERAHEWDVDVLSTAGAAVVTRFVAAVELFASKTLAALALDACVPADWAQVADALRLLGVLTPHESIQKVADTPAAGPRARVVG